MTSFHFRTGEMHAEAVSIETIAAQIDPGLYLFGQCAQALGAGFSRRAWQSAAQAADVRGGGQPVGRHAPHLGRSKLWRQYRRSDLRDRRPLRECPDHRAGRRRRPRSLPFGGSLWVQLEVDHRRSSKTPCHLYGASLLPPTLLAEFANSIAFSIAPCRDGVTVSTDATLPLLPIGPGKHRLLILYHAGPE